ncbi:hypothetical protein [Methylophaga sp.]|jgi:hypothetical protein|uniref:hypothetical protein n=1 Tax=Methylophaga sp. TaxID=2024840 RepID=UPI0014009133|nr:hypothetical protein [Methylophaga sp.]MTI63922.1 hypothetical protein [Methylophaga sp.]
MKFSPFIAPSIVLMIIAFNQTFAGSAPENQAAAQIHTENQRIVQISETCYQGWQQLGWTIGENGMAAEQHPAFSNGIKRICQARAELFFEGYEISPFIEPDSQPQIFPIVFRPSVEEIKQHLRQNLPKLRLI